jgi:glycosyltransferase involved in cell wall biosynthesis
MKQTGERRPRVVIVVTLAEVGGAQTYVAQLADALVDDFDVVVAAYGPGPLAQAVTDAGARFVALEHVRRPLSPWHDVLGLVELVRLFRRERPAIVHANSSKAGVLARLAAALTRVRSRIFTVHGWASSAHSGLAARLYELADRAMAPLTTLTICVSKSEREAGLARHLCRENRTIVSPNAVALRPVRSARPSNRASLISVGRLKAPKDFSTLLSAARHLDPRSFELAVVGDGPERDLLENEARAAGLGEAVSFLGEREDVLALVDDADVFVLSTRSEGMPMSVLEALAGGKPVVATAVGGVPELVVHGETGLLVPPEDAAALADAIGTLVADRELRERFGEAGRRRLELAFSFARWRECHRRAYARELARITAVRQPLRYPERSVDK